MSFNENGFEIVLNSGFEQFPKKKEFLFQQHKGKTACDTTFYNIGADEAMHIMRRCIPSSDNHLILHAALVRSTSSD